MSWSRSAGLVGLAAVAAAAGGCRKVPLFDVNAGFLVADAAWFEDEETLFVFWEVEAEQGLSANSVIELRYNTDEERVDWTDIAAFEPVHTHVDVDCGLTSLCGSYSLRVPIEPRDVELRLRYHRDGELSLDPATIFNVVGSGPPYGNRSLLIYGAFDELNEHIQWRGRHTFPTLRNMEAEALGLRRDFLIEDQRYGVAELDTVQNPYGYAATCPADFADALLPDVATNERAIFNEDPLPLAASDATVVCATATVTDATGTFVSGAIAQKNPEVRAAFPILRSPIHEATQLPFFLAPCDRTISVEHEEMQRQRLLIGDLPTTCIDDWDAPTFVDRLAAELTDAVEAARPAGDDMVLVIGLHQDEPGAAAAVEEALALVLPEERHRSSPRVAGAFIFDSTAHLISDPDLVSSALWCPAAAASTGGSATCAIAPAFPDIELGPFTFGTLPILPTRAEYLDFIDTYSERQAGSVLSTRFSAPEFAATAEHFDLGDIGVATFLNGELFNADDDDAFSYCAQEEGYFFLFSSDVIRSEAFASQAATFCAQDPEGLLCTAAALGVLPVEYLPLWHSFVGEETYYLGLFWDFPFLLDAEYESFLAGAVSAFEFSVPFGIATEGEAYYGSYMWTTDTFSMEEMLTQCRRFCDQPTFDGAEVYRVLEPFDDAYAARCFTPSYPSVGDPGFPFDP